MTTASALVTGLQDILAELPTHQADAVQKRAAAAHAALAGHRCEASCSDPLSCLAEEGLAPGPEAARRLAIMWLALAARLPSAAEVEDALWLLARGAQEALQPLLAAVEDTALDAVVHDLAVLPPDALLVDVTHAVLDPWYLTGIQRVVRGFLAGSGQDVHLVRVAESGRLVLVSPELFAARLQQGLVARAGTDLNLQARLVRRGIDLLLLARRPLARRLDRDRDFGARPLVRAGRRAIRALYRRDLGLERTPRETLVLGLDADLLLIEVRTEPEGVETLLRHRSAFLRRLAVVFHDAIPFTHPQYYAEPHLAGYLRYLRLVRAADVVLPVSEASAEAAQALRTLPGSAPGPVSPVLLPSGGLRPAATADARSSEGAPVVLCVSSLEPRKNHVRLLRAAQLLRERGLDFRLVLVAGGSWLSERAEQAIERARAGGLDIEVQRAVSDEALSALYAGARAAVFVSEVEGFGLPVVEALVHGTPVVCSATGSVGEVAAGGGCLTVSPYDEQAIADALGALLQDDVLCERLRAEALRRPVRGWDDYVRDVRTHLQDVAAAAR